MRTIESSVNVYQFNELSSEAQQIAIDKYIENYDFQFAAECVIEDFKQLGACFGLDIDKVFYSGFSSQGDGACFESDYRYKKGGLKALIEYAPLDTKLYALVRQLQQLARVNFYRLTFTTVQRGFYQHSGCMRVDCDRTDIEYRNNICVVDEDSIIQCVREIADNLYDKLYDAYFADINENYVRSYLADESDNEYTSNGQVYF